jgi:hypothetical protein
MEKDQIMQGRRSLKGSNYSLTRISSFHPTKGKNERVNFSEEIKEPRQVVLF